MRFLFLFFAFKVNAFCQSFNATLSPPCSIGFSSSIYLIQAYDSAGYALHGDVFDIIRNDSSQTLEADSARHISSTLFCVDTSDLPTNYYKKYKLNLVCFFSKTHYSEIHQERKRLLNRICTEKNCSVLFIQQEFPKELFSKNPLIFE